MKNVILIGSSGGNLFNLGGKDPKRLIEEINNQLTAADMQLTGVVFIGASESMDRVKSKTPARLWQFDRHSGSLLSSEEAALERINEIARTEDEKFAKLIHQGEIDAMIMLSADPERTNAATIKAAAEAKLPIVGTGGTSMASAQALGANIIAASGTTGTTNRTRAVSFATSISKHFGIHYRPVIGNSGQQDERRSGNPLKNLSIRGIMMSALPAFIALALVLAVSKIPGLTSLSGIFDTLIGALPVVLAAIAAKQISELDEVSIVAGVVAGILSVDGGIIGGLVGGILAGLAVRYLFTLFIGWKFPMTTVNIAAGGLAGLAAGLLVYFLLAPVALALGEAMKMWIEQAISFNPILAGVLAGILIWPAIIGGVYHAAVLPIVLLEMENTGNSFLGAIDMVGLVMVAAGINLANIIAPRDKGEAAVSAPGFLINMGFGTFVESAYPFMFANKFVFAGAIISSGIGGAIVGAFNVRGTAYVPSVVAPFLSNSAWTFVLAMLVPLVSACIITFLANKMVRKKKL